MVTSKILLMSSQLAAEDKDTSQADQPLISHRMLTAAEVRAIWLLLNPSASPNDHQELQIVLRSAGEAEARGWVICTDALGATSFAS